MTVFDQVKSLLEAAQISFDVLQHEPVYTSEQAAEVRGTSLSSGAKALICKVDGEFTMFVMPADQKLASKSVRKQMRARSLRFASLAEVQELTGLEPGSIPPFGSLFGIPTCCDDRLAAEARINFNAGDHSRSISMSYADYQRVEMPKLGTYT